MSTPPEQPNKKGGIAGVAIPAGLFIGMGVGFLIDELVAGMFIGIGFGFLAMIFIRLKQGES